MEFIYVQRRSGKIIAWEVGQTSQYTFRKLVALINSLLIIKIIQALHSDD